MKDNFVKISAASIVVVLLAITIFINKKDNSKTLNFFIESPNPKHIKNDQSINEAQELLSTKNNQVEIQYSEQKLSDTLIKKTSVDAGISSLGQVLLANNQGNKFTILMTISPNTKKACAAEAQIVVPKLSPISELSMLNGKTIGISARGSRTMAYLFPEFKTMGIKFKKIYAGPSRQWVMEKLKDKTIDAAILHLVQIKNAPKAKSDLGPIIHGEYENEELDIKIIKVTDTNLPCRVLFINNAVDESTKKSFLEKFQSALKSEVNIALFSDLAQIGSATPISPEELEKMTKFIQDTSAIRLRTFSDDVINIAQ